MVNIVDGYGAMGFDAAMYVPPPPDTVNYLTSSMNNFYNRSTNTGLEFFNTITDKITSYDYEKMGYMVQAVGRAINGMWMDDSIQPLSSIGDFQHPPPTMVRWLMAEPTIRKLYQNGEAEGYGDMYIDANPGMVGMEHHDYQVVTDGVIVENEDGEDESVEYFYESSPGFDPEFDRLNVNDVANIMSSWTHMAAFAKAKRDDPTSKFNGRL